MVGTLIAGVAVEGDINSDGGIALVAAASFLGLILASALLRFWLADYRKR